MKTHELTASVIARLYNCGVPLHFEGTTGSGKTSIAKQAARHLNIGYVCENPNVYDVPDAGGYPIPSKDGNGDVVTRFARPAWLRRVREDGRAQGILLFDEVSTCEQAVRKTLLAILDQRSINGHELPGGWVNWSTGNRRDEKAGVINNLAHETTRRCTIQLEPTIEGLAAWAEGVESFDTAPIPELRPNPSIPRKGRLHVSYLAFARRFPGLVFNPDPPKDPNKPRCVARTLAWAWQIHREFAPDPDSISAPLPATHPVSELVAGMIGQEAQLRLWDYIKVGTQIPEFEDILTDPVRCMLPDSENIQAQYSVIELVLFNARSVANDDAACDSVNIYLKRLNREVQMLAMSEFAEKTANYGDEYQRWAIENRKVIRETGGY